MRLSNYTLVPAPYHPKAFGGMYFQHVLVVEDMLGRWLRSNETVHHINGNTKDNRPINLFVCKEVDHNRIHGIHTLHTQRINPEWKSMKCINCGRTFYGRPEAVENRRRCVETCKRIKFMLRCKYCHEQMTVPHDKVGVWNYCGKVCESKDVEVGVRSQVV